MNNDELPRFRCQERETTYPLFYQNWERLEHRQAKSQASRRVCLDGFTTDA